jgi:hypothetical protein
MRNDSDILELKFTGSDINPSLVKPHEIAELIVGFEKSLLATLKELYAEVDTEELLFSFDQIDNQSLDLRFLPRKITKHVVAAYSLLSLSVASNDFSKIPNNAITHLKTFTKFSKKYNCIGQFNLNGETLSTFTGTTEFALNKPTYFKGETTIVGQVIDSGGTNPNVHLTLPDDAKLIFKTSVSNAQIIARSLYKKVALKGIAKWNSETLAIEDFKLTEILDYTSGNTFKAISELRDLTSGYWDQFHTDRDINNELMRD